MAGFEQLLRAKLDPTRLWDLASEKDLVLANASTEWGEPDKESSNTVMTSLSPSDDQTD